MSVLNFFCYTCVRTSPRCLYGSALTLNPLAMKRCFIAAGLCILLLGACSPAVRAPVSTPSNIAVSSGPYDGQWTGQGRSADSRPITLAFVIRDNAFTSFTYTYAGVDGTSCTGIDHQQIPAASQPKIADGAFSYKFGD